MSEDEDALEALRRRATLEEFTFTSTLPIIGPLMARLRAAWNDVATTWQARPWMERQSAFNRSVVEWLARPPGMADLDSRLIEQDRRQTALGRDVALSATRARPAPPPARLRIAYFSPMPPSTSGIADYSAELLPQLAELADVTVFASAPVAGISGLSFAAPAEYAARRAEFDVPVYQMGNSDQHETMYDVLLRFPGVVVLHDYYLHHFVHYHTAGHGDWTGYGREMAYALGEDGRRLARAVRDGQAAAPLFDVPLNRRLLDGALGLIVHSRYAAERACAARPGLHPAIIPALAEPRPGRSLRERLGIADDAVIFAGFGQITAEKRIDEALRAFAHLRRDGIDAHYLLVGEARPDVDLPVLVASSGAAEAIHPIGHVADLGEFVDWIHTADVVVNLRRPTVGETSAVALRAMAAARPLIVFDHGWYAELPDDAAVKVPPNDGAALGAAMTRLAASAELRRSMGRAGADYIHRHCLPRQVARAYVEYLRTVVAPDGLRS